MVKKLQLLIPSYYGKEDVTFHELTPEFIRAFDIYLKTEAGLCRNTIVRYMKCFKKFTNMALAKEWMRKNPFYGYKMEQDETDPVFLTYDELQTVMKKKFTIPRLELVRDVFVFACFTGLSYIDIKTLTHDKIQRMDFDGEEWIITRRTKTRVSSNVPLMEIAKELIERYRGLAGGDLVFPIPSNSVCNRHLKQIAKACGIHKEIGFHLSRHTFATTVYLCNGGTIEALSKILGHKHISTTQIYAEVTNRMVSSDFRAISGNLAAMQRSVLEKKDRKQDGKRVRRSLRETA